MSTFLLNILDKEAKSPKSHPDEIIKNLEIKEGDHIADIGSGGGFFSLEFARKVGENGRVYAVDTTRNYLDYAQKQAKRAGINNLVPVLSVNDAIALPENSIDLLFSRNTFHHLKDPEKLFQNLQKCLKPSGRVAIINNRKKGFNYVSLFGHYTQEEFLLKVMEKAGYQRIKSFHFLPRQSFNIFATIPGCMA